MRPGLPIERGLEEREVAVLVDLRRLGKRREGDRKEERREGNERSHNLFSKWRGSGIVYK